MSDLQRLYEARYRVHFGPRPHWLDESVFAWMSVSINPKWWSNPEYWVTMECVPYVQRLSPDGAVEVRVGALAIPLTVADGRTARPSAHWSAWHGTIPHFANGEPRTSLLMPGQLSPFNGVLILSQKPSEEEGSQYDDHEDMLLTYVSFLTPEAEVLEPGVSALLFRR